MTFGSTLIVYQLTLAFALCFKTFKIRFLLGLRMDGVVSPLPSMP